MRCYIARYLVLGTVQDAVHFTPLAEMFVQTRRLFVHMSIFSIARYSFIQISELEKRGVNE